MKLTSETAKAGMKVKCIEAYPGMLIKVGETYTIIDNRGPYIDLQAKDGTCLEGFYPRRFEEVIEAPKDIPVEKPLTLADCNIGAKVKILSKESIYNKAIFEDNVWEITKVREDKDNNIEHLLDLYCPFNNKTVMGFFSYRFTKVEKNTMIKVGMFVKAKDPSHYGNFGKEVWKVTDIYRGMTGSDMVEIRNAGGRIERGWYPERFEEVEGLTEFPTDNTKTPTITAFPTPPVNNNEEIMAKVNSACKVEKEAMTRDSLIKMVNAVGKHFNGPVTQASDALIDLLTSSPIDCSVQGRHTVVILPTEVPTIGVSTRNPGDEPKPQVGERRALARAIGHFLQHSGCTYKTEIQIKKEWLNKEINRLRRELAKLK